jgi:glycerol-3-phosphate acyltransferase PlsY
MADSKDILVVFLSYAIGCFSTGYYLTRLFTGKDIRKSGSGSTGARNAGRALGRIGFAVTFSGDVAKGLIAIWVASMLTPHSWATMASLLAVVTGHIWPIQLGFRGGKGIAVTLGGILVFDYWIAVACCLVFCLCFVCLRKYMLSGLTAVAIMPIAAVLTRHSAADIIGILLLAILILFAHRKNIAELILQKHVEGRAIAQDRDGNR